MSIFEASNIACPAFMTCEQAKARAYEALSMRVDQVQADADRLGISVDELAAMQPPRREGAKHVPLPDGSGSLLSAIVFNGMLLISCENGAYVRSNEGTWQEIKVL